MNDWQIEVLKFILMVLGGIITAATPIVVAYVVKRMNAATAAYGLQISATQQQMVTDICIHSVAYAEESYCKALKSGIGVPTDPSKFKLGEAVSFAISLMNEKGLPAMLADNVAKMIEARLNMARAPLTPDVPTIAMSASANGHN